MEKRKEKPTLINISRKSFIQVTLLLLGLLVVSIALTYILPKGEFGLLPDGTPNYLDYVRRDDLGGIPLWQVMNDVGGIRALVGAVSERFRDRRGLLLVLIAFLFYCFGSFLGLFEEMLTMLPIVCALCVLVGFDSFTGFICCILACGFGFAGAITNPFTVLLASEIIGANPMEHIWFRILIFFVMFGLLLAFLFFYLRRLKKDPLSSLTLRRDEALRASAAETVRAEEDAPGRARRLKISYAVFLLVSLALIVACSLSAALRGYTVPILIAYFLIFGLLAGAIACGDFRFVLKSFLRGFGGAAPTIVFIALAASIKYVFDRGAVLPTIVNSINTLIAGRSPVLVALIIYLIVLLLEFFIDSPYAKKRGKASDFKSESKLASFAKRVFARSSSRISTFTAADVPSVACSAQ